MTSVPSRTVTPATTFGNWFSPFSLRRVFEAAMTSLKTIRRAVTGDSDPLVRTVLSDAGLDDPLGTKGVPHNAITPIR